MNSAATQKALRSKILRSVDRESNIFTVTTISNPKVLAVK